jgi:hypothetical protein
LSESRGNSCDLSNKVGMTQRHLREISRFVSPFVLTLEFFTFDATQERICSGYRKNGYQNEARNTVMAE